MHIVRTSMFVGVIAVCTDLRCRDFLSGYTMFCTCMYTHTKAYALSLDCIIEALIAALWTYSNGMEEHGGLQFRIYLKPLRIQEPWTSCSPIIVLRHGGRLAKAGRPVTRTLRVRPSSKTVTVYVEYIENLSKSLTDN